MKILIVSSEIVVNKYSASVCTAKVIKDLSEKYTVDLLTEPMSIFDFTHNLNKIYITDYDIPKLPKLTFFEKLSLRFLRLNLRERRRYKAFIRKIEELKTNNYDFVLALGGGGFFEPLRAIGCIPGDIKKIGYVHDPYPGDVFPKPYTTPSNSHTLRERKKLQYIFDRLDYLAFPSFYLSEWMLKFYNYEKSKVKILPHLLPQNENLHYDTENSKDVELFFRQYNIEDNNFFLHTGTLLKHRPIQSIIKAFMELKRELKVNPKCKLVFIGDIKYELPEYDVNSVVLINKRLPLNFINQIALRSAALMIIEHDGEFSPFLPGKVPEYIAFKKPIMHFGPKKSETVRVVDSFIESKEFTAPLNDMDGIKSLLLSGGTDITQNADLVNYFKVESFLKQIV